MWPPPPLLWLLPELPEFVLCPLLLVLLLLVLELPDVDRSRTMGGAICNDRGLPYPGLP